jgi:tRNA-specific 2-thiouridylase
MSGGVDSSVAAALLRDEGYRVIGVTMQIWPSGKYEDRSGGCCGIGAVEDAQRVAYRLGIPHYVLDFRDIFARKVIADFCHEYQQGRTPNPCIRCNQHIKFAALREKARELGIDLIATGHHARIERDEHTGRYRLRKGVDPQKEQSYFLYPATQEQLGHLLFPIGRFSKERVRKMARDLKLPVASKRESQEICFIPDDDYPGFLREYIPQAARPGPIMDVQGRVLGRHQGITGYTVGQRRGLGVAAEVPLYVIAIDPERNALIVGSQEQALGDELIASHLNWIEMDRLTGPITARAKIRYRHPEAEVIIVPLVEDRVQVKFKEPQLAITPGQAVVFYHGDAVIGGGTIETARDTSVAGNTKELVSWLR